jgi:hypothetical protein
MNKYNLKQLLLVLTVFVLASSCSVEKQLKRIDYKEGALPIMNYLVDKHPELFDRQVINWKDSVRIIDSFRIDPITAGAFISDSIFKVNPVIELKTDSIDLTIKHDKKGITVKATIKPKPMFIDKILPVQIKVPCPACPDKEEVLKLLKKYQESKASKYRMPWHWRVVLGGLLLWSIIASILVLIFLIPKIIK